MSSSINFLKSLELWSGQGVLSVLGPTGSGKTHTVLNWVNTHFASNKMYPLLVSVDAVAVWKGLDIGSAKPIGTERSTYDWIGLDFLSANEASTVATWILQVKPKIEEALKHHRPVICVGGSHFYEQALMRGQAPGQASDSTFQKSLLNLSNAELHLRLSVSDPRFGAKINPNDRYRLCRFLDLAERQGLSFDALYFAAQGGLCDIEGLEISRVAIGLDLSIEQINERLKKRIQIMMGQGWVEEVQRLLKSGQTKDSPGLRSVGYADLVRYLLGETDLSEAQELILIAHRQLAKKQRTWLRGLQAKQVG